MNYVLVVLALYFGMDGKVWAMGHYCCFLLFPPFGLVEARPAELVELVEVDGASVFGVFALVFEVFPCAVVEDSPLLSLLLSLDLGLPGWGLLGVL